MLEKKTHGSGCLHISRLSWCPPASLSLVPASNQHAPPGHVPQGLDLGLQMLEIGKVESEKTLGENSVPTSGEPVLLRP